MSKSSNNSYTSGSYSGETSQTQTPIISDNWLAGYNLINPTLTGGFNAPQSQALNYFAQSAGQKADNSGPNSWAVQTIGDVNRNVVGKDIYNQPRQLDAYVPAQAILAEAPPTITAKTGAQFSDPYASLYSQNLIDPALKNFDYGTDRAFSALDARTAGAGAFGNDRSGLAYSDLGSQSALGRAQLEAGLKSQALSDAFGLGQTDANRFLQADTQNAANILANNQFNAGLQTQLNQFNAANELQRGEFNVNAGYQGDANRRALTQDYLNNVSNQNNILRQNNLDLFGAGGTGFGQNINWLNAGVPTFGTQTDGKNSGNYESQTQTSGSSKGGLMSSLPSILAALPK
jgi:hypothetical protein